MKNSPRPLFLIINKLYSWNYAFRQVAFSWHLPKPDSSIGLADGKGRFIIPETMFPLLQNPMLARFTPLQPTLVIVHGDLRRVCSCSAMNTHFMKLPKNSYCADVASRGRLELGSECWNRGQMILMHYMLQHSAVPFCELVW